ncbi:MAG: 16S rRNA (guanine(527)-N(7))-methyltransferase RsmG [Pyrinomonadaceae bacterium]
MRQVLIAAIRANYSLFNVELNDDAIDRLADYYEFVQEHNELLHLIGPCQPDEFATRHILESLTLLEYLPKGSKFADVGAGAGLPSIPCLIVREDLTAILIESKAKKAEFLQGAVVRLGMKDRAEIVNLQFEEGFPGDAEFVTCRALDKFTQQLPRLLRWSKKRTLLLFGGPTIGAEMRRLGRRIEEKLMPLSERRYLFISNA